MAAFHNYIDTVKLLLAILEVNNPWKIKESSSAKRSGLDLLNGASSSSSSSSAPEKHLGDHFYRLKDLAEACYKAIGPLATREAIKAYFIEIQGTIRTMKNLVESNSGRSINSLMEDGLEKIFDRSNADFFLASIKTIEDISLEDSNLKGETMLLVTTQFNSIMLIFFEKFLAILKCLESCKKPAPLERVIPPLFQEVQLWTYAPASPLSWADLSDELTRFSPSE